MTSQKIESQLNLALDTPINQRNQTLDLNVGYDNITNTWELIVKYNGDILRFEQELNIEVEPLSNQYAILTVEESQIDLITALPEIEYIIKPKTLVSFLDTSLRSSCITQVQRPPDNLQGEGVLIGIIDSGIDYSHPDFINPDGTSRIAYLWDQTIPGNPPKGFKGGSEYTREQINEALKQSNEYERLAIVPSVDVSGHGTHVASIAGGNGRASNGRYAGVAPKSEFIIVKMGTRGAKSFPRTTELMRGLKYVIDKALEFKKPIAVNISFGNNYGSHDGSSLLETYIDNMSNVWKNTIVIGSGNEGSASHHTEGIISSNEEQIIEFGVAFGEKTINLQIWKNYVDVIDIAIVSPSGESSGYISQRLGKQNFILGRTRVLLFFGEPSPFSQSQEIYIELIPVNGSIDSGIWKIILLGKDIVLGNYNMWLPTTALLRRDTRFFMPTAETTLTVPSTATKVISVGAYNARINSIANFSGRGYTRDIEIVKPNIVAPGVNIMAASPSGGYDVKSGTSMATPFVTGAAALLMEWGIVKGNDPYLYGQKVKAYLQSGAIQKDRTLMYPNDSWGFGSLCLAESFDLTKSIKFR